MAWWDFTNAGWVCEIADVEPESSGNEIVIGTRYSNSILIDRVIDSMHYPELVFTGIAGEPERNMWDISTGDLIQGAGADEVIGVDNTGSVYLLWLDGGVWQAEIIWCDPDGPLYAVVVGDFDTTCLGDEILVGGVSGNLTLLKVWDLAAVSENTSTNIGCITGLSITPNPFRSSLTICFDLSRSSAVKGDGMNVFSRRSKLQST